MLLYVPASTDDLARKDKISVTRQLVAHNQAAAPQYSLSKHAGTYPNHSSVLQQGLIVENELASTGYLSNESFDVNAVIPCFA